MPTAYCPYRFNCMKLVYNVAQYILNVCHVVFNYTWEVHYTFMVEYLQVLIWSPVCRLILMTRLEATPRSSSFFSPWNLKLEAGWVKYWNQGYMDRFQICISNQVYLQNWSSQEKNWTFKFPRPRPSICSFLGDWLIR